MRKGSKVRKFIVFEGIDGSGKATQTKLLVKHLKKVGYRVATIDFPQYGKKSAGLVEEYLNGKYGSSSEVGPYQASIFYACDRYDGGFKIRKWLHDGKIVVSDRYIASSIAHQGGKIKDTQKRQRFIKWLYNLEYEIFGIPKPDITFVLNTPPEMAKDMAYRIRFQKKKKYLGKKRQDIHEGDLNHLINAFQVYLWLTKKFPGDFKLIECLENGQLLPPANIHQKVWEKVKDII